jgi:hypothetical protein
MLCWPARVGQACLCLLLLASVVARADCVPGSTPDGASQRATLGIADGDVPAMDGRIEEAVWQSANCIVLDRQVFPVEGAPATQRTEVRMVLGKSSLYIAVKAYDGEPGKITGTQLVRDADLITTTT